jgi:hypothetical protein
MPSQTVDGEPSTAVKDAVEMAGFVDPEHWVFALPTTQVHNTVHFDVRPSPSVSRVHHEATNIKYHEHGSVWVHERRGVIAVATRA